MWLCLLVSPLVRASTVITVTTASDTVSDDGECSIREAITASNTDTASVASPGECEAGSGADTVQFDIDDGPTFTNKGQTGYKVILQSSLPVISETVTIDGYTQPGATANTAQAPAPLNGTLLVEISGETGSIASLVLDADDITIRGLVLNRFDSAGILPGGDGIKIQGNYIGTDPTGLIRRQNNGNGVNHSPNTAGTTNLLIGGLNPEDRNIVAGSEGSGVTPNVGDGGWTVQGNYIGMGADGETQIGNSSISGPLEP